MKDKIACKDIACCYFSVQVKVRSISASSQASLRVRSGPPALLDTPPARTLQREAADFEWQTK